MEKVLDCIGGCIMYPLNCLRSDCCNTCGVTVCGKDFDWDDALGYQTPKYVQIRDRYLGILHKLFQILIVAYVFAYKILYSNTHLKVETINGLSRLTVQAPVKDRCNPLDAGCDNDYTPLTELPYCIHGNEPASMGTSPQDHEKRYHMGDKPQAARRLVTAEDKRDCMYLDGIAFLSKGHAPGSLFLPTRMDLTQQASGCEPKAPDYACDQRWTYANEDEPWETHFVADIERFTVLIDHSFQTEDLSLAGVAGDHQGHYALPCDDPEHIQQCRSEPKFVPVPRMGDPPVGNLSSLIGLPNGDVISVGDLLRMARPQTSDFLAWQRHHERKATVRSTGAVLVVSVYYSNKKPWDYFGKAEITYQVTATMLPMDEYHQRWSNSDGMSEARKVYNAYGLSVMVSVTGDLRIFSKSQALIILTTSLVLVAAAKTIVDYSMLYLFGDKSKQYYFAKTQVSLDFNPESKDVDKEAEEVGKILDKCARAQRPEPPSGVELSKVLLNFDMRLNRIDGIDSSFTDPTSAKNGPYTGLTSEASS